MRPRMPRTLIVVLAALFAFLVVPETAWSRGGGGSSRSTKRSTKRSGPASSGSTKKSRAKSADRDKDKDKDSAQEKKAKQDAKDKKEKKDKKETKDEVRDTSKRVKASRWRRTRGGRRIIVSDWDGSACTKTETVDGVTYHYCNGSWWEKVMDGGEVYWVQVEKP